MNFNQGLAPQAEVSHNGTCVGGANEKQVGGSHYQASIQHWDYVESNGIPYLEAQVIRYVSRHAKKGGRQDLEKASHFLQKLLEVRYPK